MAADPKYCGDVELTEYTTMKAGFEMLNKRYRRNHREMEKGIAVLGKSLDELENAETVGEAVDLLDKVINAVSGSKRKASSVFTEESNLVLACKRRIEHLKQISLSEGKNYPGHLRQGEVPHN
ncbi:unnamed protein product [Protopolystoma xenopodis]|uniref:Uncharacterized protein n=1 Tax=Protopolystoma xenopodis TaxID=117903 RepID=A0A3S5C365_9PLAT|nr:unnamed protein product [Protopolystoma xenopodis]